MADHSFETSALQLFNTSGIELPFAETDFFKLFDQICEGESAYFNMMECAFVDEEEIVRVNKEFLERDYVTDTISFRYDESDSRESIEGTCYLCAPRIIEQANDLNIEPETEFKRVFVHSVLHIIGYDDDSTDAKDQMTALENKYLDL